jgi:hypothetical protein
MTELSEALLSTIAQVSATFIGFALLAPIINAGSFEHPGKRYIQPKSFFKKWLLLLILPIFVLAYPLIVSLLLLKYQGHLILIEYHAWATIFYLIFLIHYYEKLKRWSVLVKESSKFRRLINLTPSILIIFCTITSISCLIYKFLLGHDSTLVLLNIAGFLSILGHDTILVLLIITGFLLILRNIGVSVDRGILFAKEEIDFAQFEKAKNVSEYKI